VFQPAVDGRADQDDGQGEDGSTRGAHAEQGERRQPADGLAGLHSAGRQHPELDRGPHAAPPGMTRVIALPASWEVMTGNHALVRRARRCTANVQVKCAISAPIAAMSHQGFRVDRRGQDANTSVIAGNTR
jgi:hypothetical protein